EKQRLVREDVDEPWHASAAAVQRRDGIVAEERLAAVARDRQPMRDIGADFALGEAGQAVMKADALQELPDRFVLELPIELGLAEHHDVEELALLGLQIGEQADRLQRLERHRLAFIHAQHDALAQAREVEQALGYALKQAVLIGIHVDREAELLGERKQQ